MRGCWVLVCFAFLPLLASPSGGGTTHVQVRWGRSDSFCFIMGCHFYVLLSLDEMVFFFGLVQSETADLYLSQV